MIDYVTWLVGIAAVLILLALAVWIASFFIRLYLRLVKLVVYTAILIIGLAVLAAAGIAVLVIYF